jgi:uncharacterized protein YsxB (DUF464 family)
MKSDFSRFLHHTPSHSGIRKMFISSLSHSDLIGVSRSNKFANCFNLDHRVKPDDDIKRKDHRVKPDDDSVCAGRSMVEMLGVLAIIGVLSVGAIAGYSKAMMKHKLNKHAESFSMLVNEAIKLLPDLERHYGKIIQQNYNLNSFFNKANLLPDGMRYKNGSIYDIFNNRMIISYAKRGTSGATGAEYHILIILNSSDSNSITTYDKEICRNIMLTAKENYENIYYIEMRSQQEGIYNAKDFTGALSSNQTNPLNKATIAQIDDVCGSCNSETCVMYLYLSVKTYN